MTNSEVLKLKIDILKKSKEFTLDEIHGYLKVLSFPTDNDYGRWSKDDYLSWSIESSGDLALLGMLSDAFQKEAKTEIRVWKEGYYRLFISHRSEYKIEVSEIKDKLESFGIDAFVAHEDIQVSIQWRDAIVQSLKTMHCLLAYITDNFSENDWCCQEVGFACVSGSRIIPLRVQNKNPGGFLGFYQAANVSKLNANEICDEVISKVIENDHDTYIQSLLYALNEESNFIKTKSILEFLVQKKVRLSNQQIQKLEEIYTSNGQVRGYYYSDKYIEQIKSYRK